MTGKSRRKTFAPRVYRSILRRAKCICYWCEEPLTTIKETEFDHNPALELGGKDEPDWIYPMHVLCHREKTKRDHKEIAKVRRLARQAAGKPKRNPKYRRKVNGKTVTRAREPWENW